jgi:hypothetical protein
MSSHQTEELKSEGKVFTSDIQSAVKAELDLIMASPAFAQSNRCKRFLSFVVLQALAGHSNELKERTIGINVFDRAIDYDTGGDSIVRVTSNEVRKRIGQYYGESLVEHSILIELPRGSYVPEFRIHPIRRLREADHPEPLEVHQLDVAVQANQQKAGTVSTPVEKPHLVPTQSPVEPIVESVARRSRRTMLMVIAVAAAVVIVAAVFGIRQSRFDKRFPQVWESFEHANSPVVICMGTHNLRSAMGPSNQATKQFTDLVLHSEVIPVDDVTVLASMASLLGKKGIPFRVIGASQATLTELRNQPIILIGGVNNRWTLRLTQDLPYRIERVDPPGRKEPIAYIVDSQSGGNTRWTIDFAVPMNEWKNDYAVVARVDDPSTGVPILIDAGLGNDGSLAASEFLASNALTKKLEAEPGCSAKRNFEAVIETQMIDTNPGPPHVLRLQCW